MTFDKILNKYLSAKTKTDKERDNLYSQAVRAKEEALRHLSEAAKKMNEYHLLQKESTQVSSSVSWINSVVVPVVNEVNTRLGTHFDTDNLRSYGIRAECPVFDGEKHSLVFTHHKRQDGQFVLMLDTNEKVQNYPSGSIGDNNGFNKVTTEVRSIEDIIKNLKNRFPDLN